jgi:hypothetical protein
LLSVGIRRSVKNYTRTRLYNSLDRIKEDDVRSAFVGDEKGIPNFNGKI